jgi:signal transduction histidine kinase
MKNLSVKTKLIFAFLLSTTMLMITCLLAFSIQNQAKDHMVYTYEKSIPKINFIQEALNSIYQYSLKVENILRKEKKEEFIKSRKELDQYHTTLISEFEAFIKNNPNENYDDFKNKLSQVTNNTKTKLDLRLSQIEHNVLIENKRQQAEVLTQELIAYLKVLEINLSKNLKGPFLPIQRLERKLSHNKTFEKLTMKSMVLNEIIQDIKNTSNITSVFNYRNKFSLNYQDIILDLSHLQNQKNYHDFEKSSDMLDIYSKNDNLFKLTARSIDLTNTLKKLNETNEIYNTELYNLVGKYLDSFKSKLEKRRKSLYHNSTTTLIFLVLASVFFLILSAVVFYFVIQRNILDRLKKLSYVTLELARGNHDIVIQSEGKDEITEMADAAFIFKENLVDLKTSKAKLEDAYEELQQFAYRTSHDLKAPLVTIQGLSKIIYDETENFHNETVQDCLKRIDNLSTQLSTLIEDILNLAKSDINDQKEVIIDIESYLSNALQKFSNLSPKPIEIHKNWNHSFLICEPTRFLQVFENLISNVFKYVDPSKPESTLHLKTYEEGKYFVLEIEDNGLGIPKENQSKLFRMFNRFHNTSFGSGLGLYLTKKHVDRMRGSISYQNRNGNTVFIVKLPLKKVELQKNQEST